MTEIAAAPNWFVGVIGINQARSQNSRNEDREGHCRLAIRRLNDLLQFTI